MAFAKEAQSHNDRVVASTQEEIRRLSRNGNALQQEAASSISSGLSIVGKIIGSGAPKTLVQGLGSYILEVESDHLDMLVAVLSPRLGPCLQDGVQASFRIHDEHFNFMDLQAEFDERTRSVRWRRPNLNDVFLWVTDPTVSAGLTV